ncbi:hypothetical protein HQ544_00130 [Candidatus Falkowbacteria bacterium]|nr:hypothetical protein [Candidatus Falkowbacteria bacterium]
MFPQNPKNYPPEPSGNQAYCPLCEARYNPFFARVLETKDEAHLLHSECESCGSYIISLVSNTPFGLSSIGIITDLTAADVLKFKDKPEITSDDVIEFHQQFQKDQKDN